MAGNFLSDSWDNSFRLGLYTDAAASKGYGAIFGRHWFGSTFPTEWKDFNITFLELFPIVLAVHIWGSHMSDRCVLFFTDNSALVDIINKQTSKHKSVMVLLLDLVLSCNIVIIYYSALSMFPVWNTAKPIISPVFRWRASGN